MFLSCSKAIKKDRCLNIRPRGNKTFSMLNSAVREIDPAHKCSNANICWLFNIY